MSRRGRLPGALNLVGAVVIVLLVATVALRASQSSPPAIAEFAPQAQQQIKDAPKEQSALSGIGADGSLFGSPPPSPTPSAMASALAGASPPGPPRGSVRKCVGSPPRQVEDPQSPPCVPFFDADNGGATYKGVSGTTINIVMPDYDGSKGQGGSDGIRNDELAAFFNKRFEFYGRKIKLVNTTALGTGDPPSAQAAASAADAAGTFATLPTGGGGAGSYYIDMANLGMLSSIERPEFTSGFLSSHAPYIWSYPMAQDRIFGNVGQWICGRFSTGPAKHASGNDGSVPPQALQSKPNRVFGLILNTEDPNQAYDPEPLLQQLRACGVQPVLTFQHQGVVDGAGAQDSQNEVVAMRQKGVTSVICMCQVGYTGLVAHAASGQSYFPEWMLSTYLLGDNGFDLHTFVSADELPNVLGLTMIPKQLKAANRPACWARLEVNPQAVCANDALAVASEDIVYRTLFLLASGIQMAGPHLTAQSFEAGLQRTTFPNPDTSLYAGHVGFLGGSHSMTIDGAEFWWSPSDLGPYTGQGAGSICYVNHGQRYQSGQWPSGGDPFSGACDSGS